MRRGPPGSKRTDTLFPSTTPFRPARFAAIARDGGQQIPVAVIDVAANQRGQSDLLAQRRQPAQVPARAGEGALRVLPRGAADREGVQLQLELRSEEHTSELQSLMRTSYAVFCLNKKS